jgi:hypothetical protein
MLSVFLSEMHDIQLYILFRSSKLLLFIYTYTSFPFLSYFLYTNLAARFQSIKPNLYTHFIPQHFPLFPLIVQRVSTLYQIKSPFRNWDISSSCSFNWRIRSSLTCWSVCDAIPTTEVLMVLPSQSPMNEYSCTHNFILFLYNTFPLLSYFSTNNSIHPISFMYYISFSSRDINSALLVLSKNCR